MVRKFLQYFLWSLTVRLSLIFKKKQIFSNPFFVKQCTLVSNNSVLPSEFTYMTEECIHSITFSESDVIKIISALDVNKAHGHDNISVRMIKVYPVLFQKLEKSALILGKNALNFKFLI